MIGIDDGKDPDNTQIEAVGSGEPTKWNWDVNPKESGSHRLQLEIAARLSVRGHDTDLEVASSRQDVVVTDPLSRRISRFIGQLGMAVGCGPRAVGGSGVEVVQEAERPECRE